jgi:hypothetical protein
VRDKAERLDDGGPTLVAFAGYLGQAVDHGSTRWQILYLDSALATWLLVPREAIVDRTHVDDCRRDLIWVAADTPVATGRGKGPLHHEAEFVVGSLTRAEDFSPTE